MKSFLQISITIPKLKTLKNIIDRMKAMCNFVVSFCLIKKSLSPFQTLQANKSGDMTVKIETDTAQVATYFTGLHESSTTGVKIIFFIELKLRSLIFNQSFRYY